MERERYNHRKTCTVRPTQKPEQHSSLKPLYEYQSILRLKNVLFLHCMSERRDGHCHAISCDVCERWQQRLCGTGIHLFIYFAIIFALLISLYFVLVFE